MLRQCPAAQGIPRISDPPCILHSPTEQSWPAPGPSSSISRSRPHPAVDLEAAVEVTDKHDGSLGILYPAPDGRNAVATRGAFESAQALHASELYRREYERAWRPESGWTYLWEIVYPANRIVRLLRHHR